MIVIANHERCPRPTSVEANVASRKARSMQPSKGVSLSITGELFQQLPYRLSNACILRLLWQLGHLAPRKVATACHITEGSLLIALGRLFERRTDTQQLQQRY